jgi:hypothetical protein
VIGKWLAALGARRMQPSGPPYRPYPDGSGSAANAIYNLMFCDEPAAFQPQPDRAPPPWAAVLFGDPPDLAALHALAADTGQEGRTRYLAYSRLRSLASAVPPKQLLGIITEVHRPVGLDALAAFSEGGVRYVNHSTKLCVVEGVQSITPLVDALFLAAAPAVNAIGPWGKPRRTPPVVGWIRLSFLTSDGLCFGEGPGEHFQRDPLAAPVIQRAALLLKAVTELQEPG